MLTLQVDHLNLENYSNLDSWVGALNDRVDVVLKQRLAEAVNGWCVAFSSMHGEDRDLPNGNMGAESSTKVCQISLFLSR